MRPAKIGRMEAARLGLARYYTARLCKRRHRAERRTLSGSCVVCGRKAAKKWKRRNPEKVREYQLKASRRARRKVRALMRAARTG